MRELKDVLRAASTLCENGEAGAVATVVEVEGSSYRPEGARMLVRADGSRVGTISGGCLEGEVVQQAGRVMDARQPELLAFEQQEGEDPFGFGSGCGGTVHVLLEPFEAAAPGGQGLPAAGGLDLIRHGFAHHETAALATVYRAEGPLRDAVGRHLLVTAQDGGSLRGNVDAGALRDALAESAREALRQDRAQYYVHDAEAGRAEALVEIVRSPLRLLVFGEALDVRPLVRLGNFLGWEIVVVGAAPRPTLEEEFPDADRCVTLPHPEQLSEKLTLGGRDAAVVMSHNYIRDRDVLRRLLPSKVGYVGTLGARSRLQRLFGALADGTDEGDVRAALASGRLSGPVGLDLGAETPEEIALSIVSEIQAFFAGCAGGRLSDGTGRIHPSGARPRKAKAHGDAPRERANAD